MTTTPNGVPVAVCAEYLRELENWQNIRRAYEKKADPAAERRRARNRASQAKSRGNYSPTYSPERG